MEKDEAKKKNRARKRDKKHKGQKRFDLIAEQIDGYFSPLLGIKMNPDCSKEMCTKNKSTYPFEEHKYRVIYQRMKYTMATNHQKMNDRR